MHRRTFVATIAASGVTLAVPPRATAQTDAGTPAAAEETTMTDTTPKTGYADVNGLQMYYEIHGEGGVPLVLLHGGISSIDVDFAGILPALAETRQVIVMDQQGHGRTADVDRPLNVVQMADDTAALIEHLGLEQVDVFGYSMGGGIAFQLAVRRPELVRKLVVAAVYTSGAGVHPEIVSGMESLSPELFAGSPLETSYLAVAPNPDDWPVLIEKIKALGTNAEAYSSKPDEIQGIAAPVLYIIGDSDIVRPEHAVEVFRMFGGGVPGDMVGLPASRLAILPGTTHITLVQRPEWLLPMVTEFLDAPLPEGA
jgi:pimeloyl-ACP methyl ester carboxylesterase